MLCYFKMRNENSLQNKITCKFYRDKNLPHLKYQRLAQVFNLKKRFLKKNLIKFSVMKNREIPFLNFFAIKFNFYA